MTNLNRERSAVPGWIGASVAAAALVALAVIGLKSLPEPDSTPSLPAVGQASPSPVAQTPSPAPQTARPTQESPGVSATPSATSSATTSPTLTPSPTPTTSPSSPAETGTPGPGVWIGPERVATDDYAEVGLVVDEEGHAHVAAATLDDGAFYLTNASGSWTRERLMSAPTGGFVDGLSKYDGDLSIVLREDGSLAIAFTRYGGLQCAFGCVPVDPQGIFLITNRSGSWSEPVRIIEGRVQEPSLQATEGRLHLAYSRGGDEDRTVEYAHAEDEFDSWTIETVGEGRSPSLRMGRDGLARIAYNMRPYGVRSLFYAALADSGEFVTERVPGEWASDTTGAPPLLALGPTDEPQIVFFSETEGVPKCGTLSVRRTVGSWSDASVVFPEDEFCQLQAAGAAIDGNGTLHVISRHNLTSMGAWYANNAGGEFRAQQFRDLGDHSVSDIPDGDSAIAIDEGGRPHVLYVVSEFSPPRSDRGLWYGIGPAE